MKILTIQNKLIFLLLSNCIKIHSLFNPSLQIGHHKKFIRQQKTKNYLRKYLRVFCGFR